MFVYDARANHSSFFDSSFEPLFELPAKNKSILETAKRICGDCEQCVFDYVVTGSESLAKASVDAVRQHEEIVEASKKGITNIWKWALIAKRMSTTNREEYALVCRIVTLCIHYIA